MDNYYEMCSTDRIKFVQLEFGRCSWSAEGISVSSPGAAKQLCCNHTTKYQIKSAINILQESTELWLSWTLVIWECAGAGFLFKTRKLTDSFGKCCRYRDNSLNKVINYYFQCIRSIYLIKHVILRLPRDHDRLHKYGCMRPWNPCKSKMSFLFKHFRNNLNVRSSPIYDDLYI